MTAYTDDDVTAVAAVIASEPFGDDRRTAEAVLDAVAPQIAARALRAAREPTYDEVVEALFDAIVQGCYTEDVTWVDDAAHPGGKRMERRNARLESGFLSAYADGLEVLARCGKVRIVESGGRWVKAVLPDE